MRQENHTPSRLNFEFPEEARIRLKMHAIKRGISVREIATEAILDKLEELEMEEDIKDYDQAMEKYNKGEMKTISHKEMMKRVKWNDL